MSRSVLVLAQPSVKIKGWEQVVPVPPIWWVPPTGAVPSKQKPMARQPDLFLPSRDWIDELQESDTFKSQIALAGGKVQAKLVAQVIRVLVDAGDRLLKPAFSQRMNIPLMRAPTVVAATGRVLNVDGYAVIELDEASQTVKFGS